MARNAARLVTLLIMLGGGLVIAGCAQSLAPLVGATPPWGQHPASQNIGSSWTSSEHAKNSPVLADRTTLVKYAGDPDIPLVLMISPKDAGPADAAGRVIYWNPASGSVKVATGSAFVASGKVDQARAYWDGKTLVFPSPLTLTAASTVAGVRTAVAKNSPRDIPFRLLAPHSDPGTLWFAYVDSAGLTLERRTSGAIVRQSAGIPPGGDLSTVSTLQPVQIWRVGSEIKVLVEYYYPDAAYTNVKVSSGAIVTFRGSSVQWTILKKNSQFCLDMNLAQAVAVGDDLYLAGKGFIALWDVARGSAGPLELGNSLAAASFPGGPVSGPFLGVSHGTLLVTYARSADSSITWAVHGNDVIGTLRVDREPGLIVARSAISESALSLANMSSAAPILPRD